MAVLLGLTTVDHTYDMLTHTQSVVLTNIVLFSLTACVTDSQVRRPLSAISLENIHPNNPMIYSNF